MREIERSNQKRVKAEWWVQLGECSVGLRLSGEMVCRIWKRNERVPFVFVISLILLILFDWLM